VRRVAKSHRLSNRGGKLACELFLPTEINKSEGIRRVIEQQGLKAVIYLGDDMSDTGAFRMLRVMRSRGHVLGLRRSSVEIALQLRLPVLTSLIG
jgi:3-deoxy-D-manno-octulosonate 8-phosphate phosphatase KdsC-like HAD superfamily phosphatase